MKLEEIEGVPEFISSEEEMTAFDVTSEELREDDHVVQLWLCEEERKVRLFRGGEFVLSFNPDQVSHVRVQEFLTQQGLPGAARALAERMRTIRIRLA
jgi:hypothetical protein